MTKVNSFRELRMLADFLRRETPDERWTTDAIEFSGRLTREFIGVEPLPPSEDNSERQSMFRTVHLNVLACGLWNVCGRPVVTLGHKTAAACASTRLAYSDAFDFVRPPWPAFFVRLPVPLLTIVDTRNNTTLDANLMFVIAAPNYNARGELRWFFKLLADTHNAGDLKSIRSTDAMTCAVLGTGISIWRYNMSMRDMLNADSSQVEYHWETLETTDADQRTDLLCRYIALNTCLYIESPNSGERDAAIARHTTVNKRTSKPDEFGSYTNYELNAGVQLNLCDAVREYVNTGRQSKAYRRLVLPHWKRVVHGEGRAFRRLQYIESYWRGIE